MGRFPIFVLVAGAVFGQATVPFVGCKSYTQTGPVDAPKGRDVVLPIPAGAAAQLAYYTPGETGVLGPRGWSCLFSSGSGGGVLYIAPHPIEPGAGLLGPAIELALSNGAGSGMTEVARVIARVFPAHLDYAHSVEESFPGTHYPRGPYPTDKLTYQGPDVVEFETPPNTDGLGTQQDVAKGADPIRGVAILNGRTLDLMLLSVRVPTELHGLADTIIQQVEREATSAH